MFLKATLRSACPAPCSTKNRTQHSQPSKLIVTWHSCCKRRAHPIWWSGCCGGWWFNARDRVVSGEILCNRSVWPSCRDNFRETCSGCQVVVAPIDQTHFYVCFNYGCLPFFCEAFFYPLQPHRIQLLLIKQCLPCVDPFPSNMAHSIWRISSR